jgi:hypothetical protein
VDTLKKSIWPISIMVLALSLAILIILSSLTYVVPASINNAESGRLISRLRDAYLESPPYFANNDYKVTKIHLESASLYDFTNASSEIDIAYDLPPNSYLFMVNGSIKNEYSTEEIIELSREGHGFCVTGLDIYLYDAEGNRVNTLHEGSPFRGGYQSTLKGGETGFFEVAFSSIAPAERFEVYIRYLDPVRLF